MQLVHLLAVALELRGEIDDARVAERANRLSRRGVERDQVPAAVHEDPPLLAVGPRRDAAMDEAGAVRRLTRRVRLGIVLPELLARVDASSATTRLYDVLRNSVSPSMSGVA